MKRVLLIILALMLISTGCTKDNKDEEIVEVKVEDEVEKIEEQNDEVDSDIAVDREAPNFTLKNLEGEEVSLSDYRGKIVLLNFWATWCPWCVKEMPDLQRLDEENDDVVVLAIDVMEDKRTVEDYINKNGYGFEVLLDLDGELSKTYLVSGLPASYFIDTDGILLGGVPGAMDYDRMISIVEGIREYEEEKNN